MGQRILNRVLQGLQDAGIPAQRAYPSATAPQIAQPVAAVQLQKADMREKLVTVKVSVLCPWKLGAQACEDAALQVGQILNDLGGQCFVEGSGQNRALGMFTTEVSAQFRAEIPRIVINDKQLTHVLAFTSWRGLDDTVTDWADAKWNFRLEEYFPLGDEEDYDGMGQFTLIHICEDGTESYLQSTWTYQRRIWDASGVRQIRLGVAQSMDDG